MVLRVAYSTRRHTATPESDTIQRLSKMTPTWQQGCLSPAQHRIQVVFLLSFTRFNKGPLGGNPLSPLLLFFMLLGLQHSWELLRASLALTQCQDVGGVAVAGWEQENETYHRRPLAPSSSLVPKSRLL